jgi:hypothetical protein
MYTFYATFDASNLTTYIPPVSVLLPASSWYRTGMKKPCLSDEVTDRAADSGGFVASRIWGEYRYTDEEYVDWLVKWMPGWAAFKDFCCEPELSVVTEERQKRTTEKAWEMWTRYKEAPWAWVPTLQGLFPEDYRRHALQMKPLLDEMARHYRHNPAWRIGVGTLCRRESELEIAEVVEAVLSVLPNAELHLWGLKKNGLRHVFRTLNRSLLRAIKSSDSAAWHGMFYGEGARMHDEAAAHGMNRQEYTIKKKLPAYIAGMEHVTNQSPRIVGHPDTTWVKQAIAQYGYTFRLRTKQDRAYVYAVKRQGGKLKEVYLASLADVSAEMIEKKLGTFPAGEVPNAMSWSKEVQA